jgi:hypothetical protein
MHATKGEQVKTSIHLPGTTLIKGAIHDMSAVFNVDFNLDKDWSVEEDSLLRDLTYHEMQRNQSVEPNQRR